MIAGFPSLSLTSKRAAARLKRTRPGYGAPQLEKYSKLHGQGNFFVKKFCLFSKNMSRVDTFLSRILRKFPVRISETNSVLACALALALNFGTIGSSALDRAAHNLHDSTVSRSAGASTAFLTAA
jgi:hypothetical protein